MRSSLILLCIALCFTSCYAFTFEVLHRQPMGWARRGEPIASHPIRLQLALKQHNMDVLEQTLLRISNPLDSSYGQWLGLSELADIISPPQEDLDTVYAWLEAHDIYGATSRPTNDWIVVDTTVDKVEELLNCDLIFFHQKFEDNLIIRADGEYSIPDDIAEIVDFAAGVHGFPYTSWKPMTYGKGTERIGGNTPTTVQNLYGVPIPSGPCNCNSSQAVVEFSSANYSPSDLQTFFDQYAPYLEGQTIENIYGDNDPSGFISVEANLDVQYIMAIGGFIETDDYVIERNPSILDAFLQYTYEVGNQTSPPLVHSISWGDYGGDYNNNTVQRINNEFMLMGARGITVSLASGDNGVGCGDACTAQEFDFPSSPYITMVGSTGLNPQGEETGASFSSGGFSNDYYQPSYQTSAVNNYLNTNKNLPSTEYNPLGRAYPDVSTLGVALEVIKNGKSMPVDGTSCSAPIFAGMISLINAERANAGKGPMGFINPWVYQNADMFYDITSGDNSYKCCEGFHASAGWDPITGMGTPNYQAMLNSAMALP